MSIARLDEDAVIAGRYRIAEVVGRGGMGTVYRAADLRLDTDVAVKEMRETEGEDAAAREAAVTRFEREAKLLAQLSHPNLPRVTDYFVEGDRWILVMEYVEGITAAQMLERAEGGRLSPQAVLRWGEQIADVLHYLHSQQPPIVFRDVKPANIMLQADGTAKLVDFGIARRVLDAAEHDTVAYGSPGYSPPEQYGHARMGPRADVFALGATLYHLLTGDDPAAHPFRFTPLRRIDPTLPPSLEAVIAACLQTDEERRCPSAAVLRDALAQARAMMPAEHHQIVTPSVPPPAPRIVDTRGRTGGRRRSRLGPIIAVAAALVLLVAALVGIQRLHPVQPVRPNHPVPTTASQPTPPTATHPTAPLANAASAVLRVKTEPEGARVLLDGRQVGITPCEVRGVAAGSHQVTAVAPGTDVSSAQWPIEAAAGAQLTLEAELAKRDPETEPDAPTVALISDAGYEEASHSRIAPGTQSTSVLVSASFRVLGANGKTIGVAIRFYDQATGRPLRSAQPGSPLADAQGNLVAASQIRVSGASVLFPAVEVLVPREAFPVKPSRAAYDITVYLDGEAAATSERASILARPQ